MDQYAVWGVWIAEQSAEVERLVLTSECVVSGGEFGVVAHRYEATETRSYWYRQSCEHSGMGDKSTDLVELLENRLLMTYDVERDGETGLLVSVGDGEYRVAVEKTSAGVTRRPWVREGERLHGYCGGYFGRDATSCKVVVGVGLDGTWVVVRGADGWQARDRFMAKGSTVAEELRHYLEREDTGSGLCCGAEPE